MVARRKASRIFPVDEVFFANLGAVHYSTNDRDIITGVKWRWVRERRGVLLIAVRSSDNGFFVCIAFNGEKIRARTGIFIEYSFRPLLFPIFVFRGTKSGGEEGSRGTACDPTRC